MTVIRLWLLLGLLAAHLCAEGPLRLVITLDPRVAPKPAAGRLLVFMSDRPEKQERLSGGFLPGKVWIAAIEVSGWKPGTALEFNPDLQAFPKPFSRAKEGRYQFMALLDPNHTYARSQQDEGDLYSEVVQVEVDPADAEPVALELTQVTGPRTKFEETPFLRVVEMESRLLSAFWGRPVKVRAGVALPPSYAKDPQRFYPASYMIHGFGGNHLFATRRWGPKYVEEMEEGKRPEMINVFLDASFPSGHHAFADSVNNGPWGRALTEEFIPYLETAFRLIPRRDARFVTGHSSGGWSSLWLQVAYPDVFGGVWSTAPDPVDFRSFTGVDVTPGSRQNFYKTADGQPVMLTRGKDPDRVVRMEDFVKVEEAQGAYGGQMSSFEWVFSPRGEDGRPVPLFRRDTGEQDPAVQQAWRKYDIRDRLESQWKTLGPKLAGRLHLITGTEDTFHLDEPAKLLCAFLASRGQDDACMFVPGRDHSDLYRPQEKYPDGLDLRIAREMWAAFEKAK